MWVFVAPDGERGLQKKKRATERLEGDSKEGVALWHANRVMMVVIDAGDVLVVTLIMINCTKRIMEHSKENNNTTRP